jgi:hypothetical protein
MSWSTVLLFTAVAGFGGLLLGVNLEASLEEAAQAEVVASVQPAVHFLKVTRWEDTSGSFYVGRFTLPGPPALDCVAKRWTDSGGLWCREVTP